MNRYYAKVWDETTRQMTLVRRDDGTEPHDVLGQNHEDQDGNLTGGYWVDGSELEQLAENRDVADYWSSVRAAAEEAIENHPGDEAAQDEYLWQDIDGSQWVIYTARNYRVMLYTDNDDAWQEFGELSQDNWAAQVAFAAMLADAREELQRLRDEKKDESEETEQ